MRGYHHRGREVALREEARKRGVRRGRVRLQVHAVDDHRAGDTTARPDMVDVVSEHTKCALPTQVCEDLVGAGKNGTKKITGLRYANLLWP